MKHWQSSRLGSSQRSLIYSFRYSKFHVQGRSFQETGGMIWKELYQETPDDAYKRRGEQTDLPVDDFTTRAALVTRATEIIFERRPRPVKEQFVKQALVEELLEIEIVGEPGAGVTPIEDLVKNLVEQMMHPTNQQSLSLASSKHRMSLHRERMSSAEKNEAKRKNLIQKANANKGMSYEEAAAARDAHRLVMKASRDNLSKDKKELIRRKDRESKAAKVI